MLTSLFIPNARSSSNLTRASLDMNTPADRWPTIDSSTAPVRGFSDAEYARRCQDVQANMVAAGIDVLWLSTEADIRYLTGFLTQFWQSPTRPWYLLLPQSGYPVAVIPAIGLSCMQQTWVTDIRTWSSPDPVDDGVSLLVYTLFELCPAQATIGIPMGAETHLRSPLNDIENVRRALGKVKWRDATQTLRQVRQIKSAAEIDKLRHVCAIASATFADVPRFASVGMTEIDVFRAFRIACLQHGADDVPYLVGAAAANGYEDIISPASEHVLASGDILILDTGCTFDGYYADFDRNYALRTVDAATAAAHLRTWDATEAGLAVIEQGNATCASVFAAMQAVLMPGENHQATSTVGRQGHGLGIQLTETPSITAFDHSPLLPGMVMTLEPGYSYAAGKLMVHEENIVITDTGYELLSKRAPRDIPVID